MEEDRELTNLGPTNEGDGSQTEQRSTTRQPKKRFIGSRAAAQRGDSKVHPTGAENEPQAIDGALQAIATPRTRVPRRLNQVPLDILQDTALNEAIALLPSNYNFEIHKTIHRIRSSEAKNVALQFPEGLLLFAPLISDILTRFCRGTDTIIMGDVTYGACCVDDYTARALGCDLLVHYGHSCLIPVDTTKGIKTLYVFVTIGIDEEHLIATVERNFQPGQKIALVGTVQFNSALHAIVPRLKTMGFEAVLPRSAPLSAGEILGCTAPTLSSTSAKQQKPPESSSSDSSNILLAKNAATDADMILYVGDGRFHLESILIASPSLRAHTYRYDPYTRRLTHETYDHDEMHSLRRQAINAARKTLSVARNRSAHSLSNQQPTPTSWGIILGTLGRQGNPYTLSLITAHLDRLGISHITLLLSEITPQKLALMSADVAIWVQIACPRLSIDWGYAFPRPLLSPFEACIALGIQEGGSWIDDSANAETSLASSELSGKGDKDDGAATNINPDGSKIDPPVYPMDFYGKEGLGRTRAEDVPVWSALEVPVV